MSFDLAFWYSPEPADGAQALEIYQGILNEVPGLTPAHPAVAAFTADVTGQFPDLSEDNLDSSPWTSPLYFSPEFLVATISWSQARAVAPVLLALARKHGLTCFDPQQPAVVR